jgi:hypothetical protein
MGVREWRIEDQDHKVKSFVFILSKDDTWRPPTALLNLPVLPAWALALAKVIVGPARPLQVLTDDLATQIDKDFVYISAASGRSLVVRGVAPILGEAEGAGARYGTVFFEVGFVADDHEGDFLVVFDADDLFAEFGELV